MLVSISSVTLLLTLFLSLPLSDSLSRLKLFPRSNNSLESQADLLLWNQELCFHLWLPYFLEKKKKTSSLLLPLPPPALQKDSSKKSNQNHSTISLGATPVKTNLFLLSGKTIPAQ